MMALCGALRLGPPYVEELGLDLLASSEDPELDLEHEIHLAGSEALGRDTVDEPEANGVQGMIELRDLELEVALPDLPGRTRQVDPARQEHWRWIANAEGPEVREHVREVLRHG